MSALKCCFKNVANQNYFGFQKFEPFFCLPLKVHSEWFNDYIRKNFKMLLKIKDKISFRPDSILKIEKEKKSFGSDAHVLHYI